MLKSVLSDVRVRHAIDTIAVVTKTSIKDVESSVHAIMDEMASKEDLATVRWLGTQLYTLLACCRLYSYILLKINTAHLCWCVCVCVRYYYNESYEKNVLENLRKRE